MVSQEEESTSCALCSGGLRLLSALEQESFAVNVIMLEEKVGAAFVYF
jgi:hypothetical protein